MDAIQRQLLEAVSGLHEVPEGAYNIRANGQSVERNSTEHIQITSKDDGKGIDIHIADGTKNESLHIPVILSQSGLNEVVYNDFFIGDGCEVTIVAGCGIDNCGNSNSQHDGIHRFLYRQELPCEICGEALWKRRWYGKENHESRDGGGAGRGQLYGNGHCPDQRRGFHKTSDPGKASEGSKAGSHGKVDDSRLRRGQTAISM